MKVIVYDIAAKSGGGLQILKSFLSEVLSEYRDDTQWYFITSVKLCSNRDNVHIIPCESTRKSWLHRIFFEQFSLKNIVKSINPDYVISLQNTVMPHCSKPQAVYLHQSLQFCPRKFSFFKKEEFSLAFRQRIICNIYKAGLKKADRIFVQTQRIKEAAMIWLKNPNIKIDVVPVVIRDIEKCPDEISELSGKSFIYPSEPILYKNHDIIIKACKILKNRNISDYEVLFTFSPDENAYSKRLYKDSKALPIKFVGRLEHDKVIKNYRSSILLFPSYLETCGLPIIEAKMLGGYILASNLPFSLEALNGYDNAELFSYSDENDLADKMQRLILNGCKTSIFSNDNNDESISLLEAIKNFTKESDKA